MYSRFTRCKCKANHKKCPIIIDYSRESIVSEEALYVAKKIYNSQYSNMQDLFADLAREFAINCEHAQRVYDYISKMLFMPATPIIRYVNKYDVAPISCFTNYICNTKNIDFIEEIKLIYKQMLIGGGASINISNVKHEEASDSTYLNNGILRYIRAIELMHSCLEHKRDRASISSYYLDINHPEIEKFIHIRKPTTEQNMIEISTRCNIGVIITDEFMECVISNKNWQLIDKHENKVYKIVSARKLWLNIIAARLETGEPYIYFEGNVEKFKSEAYQKLKIKINSSNICTEITLPCGRDHENKIRSGVCCLGSINFEHYDQILEHQNTIFEDCLLYLDNVIQRFIEIEEKDLEQYGKNYSYYGAIRGRSLGLGITGLHNLFMCKKIAFDSPEAKKLNIELCTLMKKKCDEAQINMANAYGRCPDNEEADVNKRCTTSIAIAPCVHISMILNTSLGINPTQSNYYIRKTSGKIRTCINKFLFKYIKENLKDKENEIIDELINHRGSIQHIDYFSQEIKEIFKTAYEIDQVKHIEMCADRNKIFTGEQAQSINIFIDSSRDINYVNRLHIQAFRQGIKTLYYLYNSPVMFANNNKTTNSNPCINGQNKQNKCYSCD